MKDKEVRHKTTELMSFAKENELLRAKISELEQDVFRLKNQLPQVMLK
jgi:uncharacterized protein YigA (DUF484 family)